MKVTPPNKVFKVNKVIEYCFEHLHEKNAKPSISVSVSHAQPQFCYGFYRREGRSDGTLIKWDRNVDVLVTVFPPPLIVVKLQASEAAIPG